MDKLLYINTVPDIRIREMVNTVSNSEEQEQDYSKRYLTFEALEDATISINIETESFGNGVTFYYKVDNEKNWQSKVVGDGFGVTKNLYSLSAGQKLQIYCIRNQYYDYNMHIKFNINNRVNVSGNILSIFYGDQFTNYNSFPAQVGAQAAPARDLFSACKIVDASNLILPDTAPANCYYQMFYNCTTLTTAPTLPATTLNSGCYTGMFNGCRSLNYIKALFTTTPSTTYTNNWVNGVAATGTFIKNANATWNVTGTNGVPAGWSIQLIDQETGEVLPPM